MREAFQGLGARVFAQEKPGLDASRREAFTHARDYLRSRRSAPDELLIYQWTEPEKEDMIRLIPELIDPIIRNEADILIMSRTEKSWASYPSFQRKSETVINRVFCFIVELPPDDDIAAGPVAWRDEVMDYFIEYNPDHYGIINCGYRQYLGIVYARLVDPSLRIKIMSMDFMYSPAQKAEEENEQFLLMIEKRLDQLDANVDAYFKIGKALRD